MEGRMYVPGLCTCPAVVLALSTTPSQLAIGRWGWGFHNVRDDVDPGILLFRPRVVGVVNMPGT